MAFNLKQLCRVGSDLVEGSVKRYDYLSTDTVTGAGYFPTTSGIKAGDLVTKIVITLTEGLVTAYAKTEYYMVADANGVLTATALLIPAASISVDASGFTNIAGATVQAALASVDTQLT